MEKVIIEKKYLLSYGSIYNDEIDPAILLRNIPQVSAIEFISYLLHLYNVRKRDNSRFQSRHLYQWMMQTTNDNKLKMLGFIEQESELIDGPNFKLIDRRPCLDLIQHILVFSAPGDTTSLSHDQYTLLFKCLLHFNSIENKAQEQLFNWDGEGNLQQFVDFILTVQVRNIENERFKDYVIQFLKVYYFFVFCESHEKYSAYLTVFLKSLGLASYKNYLWKIISPYLELMVSEEPTPKMHIDDERETLHFYNRLTINGKIASTDNDYKPLRQYPLYKTEKNMYVFMDFRFFVDKFYQGFLFDFAAETKIGFSSLKTDMGNLFSEHILFYMVMDKCFNKYGSVRLTGEEIKAKIPHGEPDYYLRAGSNVFLFEFKDIIINADIKYSGDAAKIKAGILQKLERNAEGKRKGITQLLNTIKEINGRLYKDKCIDTVDPNEVMIYPIIVHTDITLESYGVNYFLNERFNELIAEYGLNKHHIKNLILINLDSLIQLQDHFRNGKLNLEDCINSYLSYISVDEPAVATFPFDEYIKYYFVQKTKERIGNPKEFNVVISSFAREV